MTVNCDRRSKPRHSNHVDDFWLLEKNVLMSPCFKNYNVNNKQTPHVNNQTPRQRTQATKTVIPVLHISQPHSRTPRLTHSCLQPLFVLHKTDTDKYHLN